MIFLKYLKSLLICATAIFIVLIAVSLFDVLLVFFYPRFYSAAVFIVLFGVGGIFAAAFGYMYGIEYAAEKNEPARWSLIAFIVITGLLFFFILSKIEGGEYEPAFKGFGATLSLGSLLFVRGKVDV
jgi:hypothetical protein